MSQRDDLKLLCENSVGFGDVSLAPDVVLVLLAELDVSNNVGRALSETLESVCESRDALVRVVEQMKVESEALRKDAERYQWLRLADWWRSPICVIRNPKEQAKLGTDCPTGERLDEAVDAAMGNREKL